MFHISFILLMSTLRLKTVAHTDRHKIHWLLGGKRRGILNSNVPNIYSAFFNHLRSIYLPVFAKRRRRRSGKIPKSTLGLFSDKMVTGQCSDLWHAFPAVWSLLGFFQHISREDIRRWSYGNVSDPEVQAAWRWWITQILCTHTNQKRKLERHSNDILKVV